MKHQKYQQFYFIFKFEWSAIIEIQHGMEKKT
jgi:hypothetical protein